MIPSNTIAEQGVLGCVLSNPSETFHRVIDEVNSDMFYDVRHKTMWDSVFSKCEGVIDPIKLSSALKESGKLDGCGGFAYISELADVGFSAALLDGFLTEVKTAYRRRRLYSACKRYVNQPDTEAMLEQEVLAVGQERVPAVLTSGKDLALKAIDAIERRDKGEMGLPSGFHRFDFMTKGFRPGKVYVLAARPGEGKTSLAMNWMWNVSKKGIPSVIFSLEMDEEELGERWLYSAAGTRDQSEDMVAAAKMIASSPLSVDSSPGLTLAQLQAKARKYVAQHGVKLIVIDYLQLMQSSGHRENQNVAIENNSKGIKLLARELKVPIILLSQLNREKDKDSDRKPRLSDLRGSGSIEQDADLVAFIQDNDLFIEKQRSGPRGHIPLSFQGHIFKFEEQSPISENV